MPIVEEHEGQVIFHGDLSNIDFEIAIRDGFTVENMERLDRIMHALQNNNEETLRAELNNFPHAFITNQIWINEGNVYQIEEYTNNPLYRLLLAHDTRIKNEKLERGEDIDEFSWMITAHYNKPELLRYLVRLGWNVDETPANGGGDNMTALTQFMQYLENRHARNRNDNFLILRTLLELGANPNIRTENIDGEIWPSPMQIALRIGYIPFINLLVAYGGEEGRVNEDGDEDGDLEEDEDDDEKDEEEQRFNNNDLNPLDYVNVNNIPENIRNRLKAQFENDKIKSLELEDEITNYNHQIDVYERDLDNFWNIMKLQQLLNIFDNYDLEIPDVISKLEEYRTLLQQGGRLPPDVLAQQYMIDVINNINSDNTDLNETLMHFLNNITEHDEEDEDDNITRVREQITRLKNQRTNLQNQLNGYIQRIDNYMELIPVENPEDKSASDLTCAICGVNKKTEAILPCGHLALCQRCKERMPERGKCPLCNKEIDGFLHVFYFGEKEENGCVIL